MYTPVLFCQGFGMPRYARISPKRGIRRLGLRRLHLLLVGLSLGAFPVAAEERDKSGPPGRHIYQTVSEDNQTRAPVQSRSTSCLTDAEILALFDRLDRDGDGRLTRADSRRREVGRDRIRVVAPDRHTLRFDLDGDGVATRREVVTAPSCVVPLRRGQMRIAEESVRNPQ